MSKASAIPGQVIPGPTRDLVGYNGKPPKVTWPGGARIAISLVVNYEEGSELAVGDGDADARTGACRNRRCGRGRRASAISPWRPCTNTARASASGG